jgi:lipopolysaccharide transport system permease protein
MAEAEGFTPSVDYLIEPSSHWWNFGLKELWEYRDLLYFIGWRDVRVRYKQTALGAAWAVLQPLLTMLVFTIVFGKLAKVSSGGVPYPVFAYVALLPWQLFAFSLTESSNSLISNQNLVKKVYFPRLAVPVASVFAGLVDFAISFLLLIALMAYYHIKPTAHVAYLPLYLALAVATALTAGLWLSALNVRFRDVRYMVPFLTQFWLFITPVAYPASLIPEHFRAWYGLNPMAGVVEGFRNALLGTPASDPHLVWISVAVVALLLVGGLIHFRRMEATFADVI